MELKTNIKSTESTCLVDIHFEFLEVLQFLIIQQTTRRGGELYGDLCTIADSLDDEIYFLFFSRCSHIQ